MKKTQEMYRRKSIVIAIFGQKLSELRDSNTFDFSQSQRLVRSAVIYGPNAGGKSNLIRAIFFLQQFVLASSTAYQEKQKIPLQHFRLNANSQNEPSEFSIDFIYNDVRFTYHVALTEDQIISEELYAYPKNYRQTWFTRKWNPSSKAYEWYQGPSFKREHKVWEQMTRANALYLSTAVQFNSEQLKPVFLWFRDQLVILLKNGPAQEIYFNPDLTFQYLKDPKTAPWIHKFMACADIGIENFHLIEEEAPPIKKVAVRTQHKILDSDQKVFFDPFCAGKPRPLGRGLPRLAPAWTKSIRRLLLLNILANYANRSSSATARKVTRRPQSFSP